LLAATTKTPHSLLWFAVIQIVERIKKLPGLAPKHSFLATEAVEGTIGQIAEPQENNVRTQDRGHPDFGLKLVRGRGSSGVRSRDRAARLAADPTCIEERI
jgi:hypothetical protein